MRFAASKVDSHGSQTLRHRLNSPADLSGCRHGQFGTLPDQPPDILPDGTGRPHANKHYWQVTDEDFERAIQGSSKATQNPAQHLHVSARTDSQSQSTAHEKTTHVPADAASCGVVLDSQVEDRGLEPVPSFPQKTPLLKQSNAQYNALFGDDERLRLLLEAWAKLPESVKAAVMAMARG
jgi:hypothetical protein